MPWLPLWGYQNLRYRSQSVLCPSATLNHLHQSERLAGHHRVTIIVRVAVTAKRSRRLRSIREHSSILTYLIYYFSSTYLALGPKPMIHGDRELYIRAARESSATEKAETFHLEKIKFFQVYIEERRRFLWKPLRRIGSFLMRTLRTSLSVRS